MTKLIYPPFTEGDFSYPGDVDVSESIIEKAKLIRDRVERDHDDLRHEFRWHPWCRDCELDKTIDGLTHAHEFLTRTHMSYLRESFASDGIKIQHGSPLVQFLRDNKEATADEFIAHAKQTTGKTLTDHRWNLLHLYTVSARHWMDWSVDDDMRAVIERICIYLLIYGKPPVDTYDPDVDSRSVERQFLSVEDLDNLPEPEWMIPGILTRYAYAVLRGRDHAYKSFVALSWAASIATGRPWLGRPVQQGRVLYLVAEGAEGMGKRVRAWRYAWYDNKPIEADALAFTPQPVDLFAGGADLEQLLDHIAEREYALVVVDTLNKCSGAADINGPQANAILRNIDRIKRATTAGSVLVVAHTTKGDDDVRGWSGLEDDADIVWHAKADDVVVSLANTKMKESAATPTLKLKPLPIPEADSVVLQMGDDFEWNPELTESQTRLLKTLDDAFSESGATKREMLDASGLPRSTFYHALNALKRSGDVVVEGKGDRAIHRLASKPVQSASEPESLTNSNQSNAVQSNPTDDAVCLSKSNTPKGLDVGQTALDGIAS